MLVTGQITGGPDAPLNLEPSADSSSAIEALYRARYAGLVRQARMIVGSAAVAEELVQEAFVRLQPAWSRAADPGAYVHRIVVNLCRSWCERRGREEAYLAALTAPVSLNPEHDDTWTKLLLLPVRHRTALVLRFYADLSEAEIAAAMDCRLGTVKSLIHRGLAKLRADLAQPADGRARGDVVRGDADLGGEVRGMVRGDVLRGDVDRRGTTGEEQL